MSIIKKVIGDNEYLFVNESRSNRSGFVHETKLYKNGNLWGEYHIQYINRTWECYQYQSVMRGVVNSILDAEFEYFEKKYRRQHNIKRLTAKKHDEMICDYAQNKPEYIEEFEKLYTMI